MTVLHEFTFNKEYSLLDFAVLGDSIFSATTEGVYFICIDIDTPVHLGRNSEQVISEKKFHSILLIEGQTLILIGEIVKSINLANDSEQMFSLKMLRSESHIVDVQVVENTLYLAYADGVILKRFFDRPGGTELKQKSPSLIRYISPVGQYLYVNTGSSLVRYNGFNPLNKTEYPGLRNITNVQEHGEMMYAIGLNESEVMSVFSKRHDNRVRWGSIKLVNGFNRSEQPLKLIVLGKSEFIIGLKRRVVIWKNGIIRAQYHFDEGESLVNIKNYGDSLLWVASQKSIRALDINSGLKGPEYLLPMTINKEGPVYPGVAAPILDDIAREMIFNDSYNLKITIYPHLKEKRLTKNQKAMLFKKRKMWFTNSLVDRGVRKKSIHFHMNSDEISKEPFAALADFEFYVNFN